MRSRDKWQLLKLPYHNAMVTKFAHLQKTYEKLQTLKLDNLMLLFLYFLLLTNNWYHQQECFKHKP